MGRRFTWLDVFSAEPLRGNPLAVVHDADDVDEESMLAFARETGLSETTFLQAPTVPGEDYRNRIWDTKAEMPFAGHPSLGSAVALAHRSGAREARYVQQTHAGLQPIDVVFTGERLARASMLQEPATFLEEPDPGEALAAVGLTLEDLDPALPVRLVSTGVAHLLLCVRDSGALDRCAPAGRALQELLRPLRAATLYVAHVEPELGFARARGFLDDAGAAAREDPATGSAAGPLCAYVHVRTGVSRLIIDQGAAMGRPGRLEAELDGERVRVAGDVVVLAEGTVHL